METMSIGEAKSRFSELISRAMAGERLLIRRRNRPVAVLIGSAELERRSDTVPRLAMALGQDAQLFEQVREERIHPAMAACGLWRDVEDLATLADEITVNRQQQVSRAEVAL